EYALQFRGRFPDPGPWKLGSTKPINTKSYVGVDNAPKQYVSRQRRRPYAFNVMVVGESGLGKTTFINTLFHSVLKEQKCRPLESTKTVEINAKSYDLTESGVHLRLSVIDTPGFGDRMNRYEDLNPIIEYIDTQNQIYLQQEQNRNPRPYFKDSRVHLLLYFISPTGERIKDLDIFSLSKLSGKVNIIPVIAKSDTLTADEKIVFKNAIMKRLEKEDIKIYPYNYCDDRASISHLETHIPFAVVGCNTLVEVNGKRIRGRAHRWGIIDVENEQHSDFIHLRELIMSVTKSRNLNDLVISTNDIHYNSFRTTYLQQNDTKIKSVEAFEGDSGRHQNSTEEERLKNTYASMLKNKEEELKKRNDDLLKNAEESIKSTIKEKESIEEEIKKLDEQLKILE
ncbi:Septin, partial [Rozella allomycis CSF55]